jgi:hypothetical protein
MLKVVHDADASNQNGATGGSLLDEIVRDGARAMLATALQAEVAAYIDAQRADHLQLARPPPNRRSCEPLAADIKSGG